MVASIHSCTLRDLARVRWLPTVVDICRPAAGATVSHRPVRLCAPPKNVCSTQGHFWPSRVTFYRLTSVQTLSSLTAIRSGAGKLVRSPPTPNAASGRALTGASQKISHLKVQHTLQPPTVSHHHTQSFSQVPVPSRGSSHNRKETKKYRKPQKNPVRRTRPLRQPLHRCRATFSFTTAHCT